MRITKKWLIANGATAEFMRWFEMWVGLNERSVMVVMKQFLMFPDIAAQYRRWFIEKAFMALRASSPEEYVVAKNTVVTDLVGLIEIKRHEMKSIEEEIQAIHKISGDTECGDIHGNKNKGFPDTIPTKMLDLSDGVKLELVWVNPGEFEMGSVYSGVAAMPVHKVTLKQGFFMGKYEVTQAQYEKIMGNNPSKFKGAKRPVECVSWDDAVEFCKKLSAKTGLTVRLPSEAEWEYACRAGSTTAYCFGDDARKLGEYAVYWDNNNLETKPVGGKKSNAWGLYDMHGNVLEWCFDLYTDNYDGAPTDGSTRVDGKRECRVVRGGSWVDCVLDCRSVYRYGYIHDIRRSYNGFRVVVEV